VGILGPQGRGGGDLLQHLRRGVTRSIDAARTVLDVGRDAVRLATLDDAGVGRRLARVAQAGVVVRSAAVQLGDVRSAERGAVGRADGDVADRAVTRAQLVGPLVAEGGVVHVP